jgi:3-oxo-5-alpha-steroid 4-dehydrogenase 1
MNMNKYDPTHSAPYGKTINYSFGPLISPRIGWFCFESINLAWCYLCWKEKRNSEAEIPAINKVLLSIFSIHYIQRSIIYPILMPKTASRMPLMIIVAAACFCGVNG